jgi:hypothetical protein
LVRRAALDRYRRHKEIWRNVRSRNAPGAQAIPGAESLTIAYCGDGNELVTIAGRTVAVRPGASIAEIELAFREPAMNTPNVTVTPLPAVAYEAQPIDSTRTATMTNPAPGGFAAGIRAMMDEARAGVAQARADGLAKVGEAVQALNEAKTATAHVADKMAGAIHSEAADVMAELGQISNDLGMGVSMRADSKYTPNWRTSSLKAGRRA